MPKKIDLTNQQFGEWTVIREASKEEKQNKPGAYWLCHCSCGNKKIVNGQTLRNGESKSCGCKTTEYISKKNTNKAEDLTGQNFGRLTVLERDLQKEYEKTHRGSTYWKCQCECGNIITVLRSSLKNKTTQSCGCIRKEKAKQHLTIISSNRYVNEIGNKYGKLNVIAKSMNKGSGGVQWICQCDCGNITIVSSQSLRSGNTSSCGCLTISKGEYKIKELLKDNNILYIKEYPVNINNKNLRFDFAILDKNKIKHFIEFDGEQHFRESTFFGGDNQFQKTQYNDNLKNQWCIENNIPLIRIPYHRYINLNIEDLLLETSSYVYKV